MSSAGDVDGDGRPDLLFGAPMNPELGYGTGKAYLILGSTIMAQPEGTEFALSTQADYSFTAEEADDRAGSAVTSVGDLDGDGLDDFMIASERAKSGQRGATYLFLASEVLAMAKGSDLNLTDAAYTFVGEFLGDMAGTAIASAGDVDADGRPDLLIGANDSDQGLDGTSGLKKTEGKAYLWLAADILSQSPPAVFSNASASYSFIGTRNNERLGRSVASARDVDGDGRDDLLIGAPHSGTDRGYTYLMYAADVLASTPGTQFAMETDASVIITGNYQDSLGAKVSTVGDVNGDGRPDLLLGGPRYNIPGTGEKDHGQAYLLLNPY